MFKFTLPKLHCSNLITPSTAAVTKRVKKCPLNKTARNLYVTYITLAVTLPFSVSYIYNLKNKNSALEQTLLIEEQMGEDGSVLPAKKRQHSVRYIF